MFRLSIFLICMLLASAPALAQADMPQPSGPADLRVDGRPNKREGLPPSAADRDNGNHDNRVYQSDCAEVDQLNPNARPGYQARVRQACGR